VQRDAVAGRVIQEGGARTPGKRNEVIVGRMGRRTAKGRGEGPQPNLAPVPTHTRTYKEDRIRRRTQKIHLHWGEITPEKIARGGKNSKRDSFTDVSQAMRRLGKVENCRTAGSLNGGETPCHGRGQSPSGHSQGTGGPKRIKGGRLLEKTFSFWI